MKTTTKRTRATGMEDRTTYQPAWGPHSSSLEVVPKGEVTEEEKVRQGPSLQSWLSALKALVRPTKPKKAMMTEARVRRTRARRMKRVRDMPKEKMTLLRMGVEDEHQQENSDKEGDDQAD